MARRELRMTPALAIVLLGRWVAWAIAAAIVFGRLESGTDATREPALLVAAFAQCAFVTAAVTTGGRRSISSAQRSLGDRADLILLLGLADTVLALLIVFLSGGRESPYYLFAVAAFLLAASGLGLRSVILLGALFLSGYVAVLSLGAEGAHRPYRAGEEGGFAALLALPIPIALLVQLLSAQARSLAAREEEATRLLAENLRLQQSREELAAREERTRIAREIHDGIGQSMYMLSLNLETAVDSAGRESDLGQQLQNLVVLARGILLEVRQYIFELRPLLDRKESLASALRRQAKEFSKIAGLDVSVDVVGDDDELPLRHRTTMYRIAQEALSNVYRHAYASRASVRLVCEAASVTLEVSDDGVGLAGISTKGRGLDHIAERAQILGGTVRVEAADEGKGVRVSAMLPRNGHGQG